MENKKDAIDLKIVKDNEYNREAEPIEKKQRVNIGMLISGGILGVLGTVFFGYFIMVIIFSLLLKSCGVTSNVSTMDILMSYFLMDVSENIPIPIFIPIIILVGVFLYFNAKRKKANKK